MAKLKVLESLAKMLPVKALPCTFMSAEDAPLSCAITPSLLTKVEPLSTSIFTLPATTPPATPTMIAAPPCPVTWLPSSVSAAAPGFDGSSNILIPTVAPVIELCTALSLPNWRTPSALLPVICDPWSAKALNEEILAPMSPPTIWLLFT
ncbi:hypothetical protein D9M73_184220 [compost metagenome]